ncbi:hypothetical protein V1227_34020 [Lentzea sp. DG1S-22]|uniref:hypothetical protein n=1 Tax=Lentzea sp. DG1S-22 TaxID=3108822 RepID=UPI002E7A926B|nr:hypothetical protein [Lentzea sp. DG1S-22]WVH79988.1 hypothetical protein V1227_34020 [Lentzea sp. DG1S-22]
MSTPREPRRRQRYAVLLSLALLAGFVCGFLTGMPGMAPLVAVPVVVLCAFLAGFAMLKLRPNSSGLLAAPLAVLVVTGLSVVGGQAAWLAVFGEQVPGCAVTSVNEHTGSKSATKYSNDLLCGERKIAAHFPAGGQDEVRGTGDRVDLVIDRTGVMRVLEPSEVTWWRTALVPISAVAGVAFVVAVLKRRRWKPGKPAARRELGRDFL